MTIAAPAGRPNDVQLLHVSKRYRLRGAPPGTQPPRGIWNRIRGMRHDFWALRDVTFDVLSGSTVGIIGHNGAGKSTLLKLLSAITAPTEGEIRIRGRLSALIELGSGFHPELTGRENLYLSGTLLGMTRREIASKLDLIVDFAGVGEFLDVPVKWYSSGMYVRLGFSIAAHLDPDILLVDEVLAVGDAEFQLRCYTRIRELQAAGMTIVFISHDLSAVERLCTSVVLLARGEVVRIGDPAAVIGTYQRMIEGGPSTEPGEAEGLKPAQITGVTVHDGGGLEVHAASTGEPLEIRAGCTSRHGAEVEANLYFHGFHDGVLHCVCSTAADGPAWLPAGASTLVFSIPALSLKPGVYTLGLTLAEPAARRPFDWRYARTTVHVRSDVPVAGRFYMPCATRVAGADAGRTHAHAGDTGHRGTTP